MRRKPSFDRRICQHAIHLEISIRISFFLHVFLAAVRTRCLSCMQPLLELKSCSINIRMQTIASCDVQPAAWARTEFACALVDSVGRDATAADVGRATPLQPMLTVLNRRALSAWTAMARQTAARGAFPAPDKVPLEAFPPRKFPRTARASSRNSGG